jgi:hypothetical protein
MIVDDKGYLARKTSSASTGHSSSARSRKFRNWWLIKPVANGNYASKAHGNKQLIMGVIGSSNCAFRIFFPRRFIGKRVAFKLEFINNSGQQASRDSKLSQKDISSVEAAFDDEIKSKILLVEDVASALAWAKSWTDVNVLAICPHCSKERLIFSNPEDEFDHSCKNCLVDRAFGEVNGK